MNTMKRHAILWVAYDVTVTSGGVERRFPNQERETALRWIRTGRSVPEISVRVSRHWVYGECYVTYCAACLARPSLWDMDCDGAYDTVSCGVCDWLTAFEQRHPLPTCVDNACA